MSYEKLQKRCMKYKDLWLDEKKEKWEYLFECRRLEKVISKRAGKIFELELKVQKLQRERETYMGIDGMKKRMENEV